MCCQNFQFVFEVFQLQSLAGEQPVCKKRLMVSLRIAVKGLTVYSVLSLLSNLKKDHQIPVAVHTTKASAHLDKHDIIKSLNQKQQ